MRTNQGLVIYSIIAIIAIFLPLQVGAKTVPPKSIPVLRGGLSWTLYDNRADFENAPGLIRDLAVNSATNSALFDIDAAYFEELPMDAGIENGEGSFIAQFEDIILRMKDASRKTAKHEMYLFIDSHGGNGIICRQNNRSINHAQYLRMIFDKIDQLYVGQSELNNFELNIFYDACHSQSLITAMEEMLPARAERTYHINIMASAQSDSYGYGNVMWQLIASLSREHQVRRFSWELLAHHLWLEDEQNSHVFFSTTGNLNLSSLNFSELMSLGFLQIRRDIFQDLIFENMSLYFDDFYSFLSDVDIEDPNELTRYLINGLAMHTTHDLRMRWEQITEEGLDNMRLVLSRPSFDTWSGPVLFGGYKFIPSSYLTNADIELMSNAIADYVNYEGRRRIVKRKWKNTIEVLAHSLFSVEAQYPEIVEDLFMSLLLEEQNDFGIMVLNYLEKFCLEQSSVAKIRLMVLDESNSLELRSEALRALRMSGSEAVSEFLEQITSSDEGELSLVAAEELRFYHRSPGRSSRWY